MNKLEQAARQALEALEQNTYYNFDDDIKALREALAEQAEQEPCIECGRPTMSAESKCNDCHSMDDAAPVEPVKQEPVAWMDLHKELGKLRWMGGDEGWDNAINAVRDRLIELATPRPVRTKDLTDDEIAKVWKSQGCFMGSPVAFARAVIAADREKNK